jgi:hypothetical protein
VEEIWANYISNAIKYGGDPPRLELGAESNGNGKAISGCAAAGLRGSMANSRSCA